jgi:hypothetical protein
MIPSTMRREIRRESSRRNVPRAPSRARSSLDASRAFSFEPLGGVSARGNDQVPASSDRRGFTRDATRRDGTAD